MLLTHIKELNKEYGRLLTVQGHVVVIVLFGILYKWKDGIYQDVLYLNCYVSWTPKVLNSENPAVLRGGNIRILAQTSPGTLTDMIN